MRGNIYRNLIVGQDLANAGLFLEAEERSLGLLEEAWLRFVQKDVITFIKLVMPQIYC